MQLWKNKNLTAEVNFWEISLSPKLTNFCEIVNFFCPDMSMQNTEIREGNLKKNYDTNSHPYNMFWTSTEITAKSLTNSCTNFSMISAKLVVFSVRFYHRLSKTFRLDAEPIWKFFWVIWLKLHMKVSWKQKHVWNANFLEV